MNKSQRVVVGIVLILMGFVTFIFAVLIGNHLFSLPLIPPGYVLIQPGIRKYIFELYPAILLSIAFTGGGVFLLVSKKGR